MYDLQQTVGRLVSERPGRARVFEEFDIDYCCGGKRTLADACARLHIDPAVVVRRLEALDAGPDADEADKNWDDAPVTELCDHIVTTHHAFLRRELLRVAYLVQKIARVHGDRQAELRELLAVFQAFARDMELHMDKEEMVLFPALKRLAAGELAPSRSILGPVRMIEAEHDEAAHALAEMRRLTDGFRPPTDACNSYQAAFAGLHDIEQDLHRHVHLENNVLFPRVEECLAVPVH
jgi:regulator of cell morphogenesis and NO signaling